jgi:hypothetical protein
VILGTSFKCFTFSFPICKVRVITITHRVAVRVQWKSYAKYLSPRRHSTNAPIIFSFKKTNTEKFCVLWWCLEFALGSLAKTMCVWCVCAKGAGFNTDQGADSHPFKNLHSGGSQKAILQMWLLQVLQGSLSAFNHRRLC